MTWESLWRYDEVAADFWDAVCLYRQVEVFAVVGVELDRRVRYRRGLVCFTGEVVEFEVGTSKVVAVFVTTDDVHRCSGVHESRDGSLGVRGQ